MTKTCPECGKQQISLQVSKNDITKPQTRVTCKNCGWKGKRWQCNDHRKT